MNLKREHVQHLFDMCVQSMDFGSGFLDSDDVDALRAVAVALGIDPLNATPSEFRRNYPHPFRQAGYLTRSLAKHTGDSYAAKLCTCGRYADADVHSGRAE